MKKSILAMFLLISAVSSAQAENLNYAGQFSSPHKTFIVGYEDERSCNIDKGEWDREVQMCLFDASDEVTIERWADGGLSMNIETVGQNGHSCGFASGAKEVKPGLLVGSAETEVFRYNEETKQSEPVKAICEVYVSYSDSNTVSVEDNGNCTEFCGARAALIIGEAKRSAPKAD